MVQTPVPKTGRRASVRVRLLHLPPLEDDLAVARAPFATRMDPDGLRFDSAGFRVSCQFRTLHRNGGPPTRSPAGSTGTSFISWPLEKAIAPAALERAPSRFRAPHRRSPTRKHLVRLQIGPLHGPSADGRHFPVKETNLAASTLGRASPFWRVPPSRAHTHLDSSSVEHQLGSLSVAGLNPAPTHNAPLTRTRRLFSRPAGQAPHAEQRPRVRIPPRVLCPRSSVVEHSTVNGHRGLPTRARDFYHGGPP